MGTDIPNTAGPMPGWAPGDPLHEAPTPDLELDAIETLAAVFGALDVETRARVLRWAQDRYVTNAESEARTLDSESKVPEDEVSQVNDSSGKRRGDPKSAQCPYGDNGDHEWGPDPDDPDVGDACTLCGVGR